MIWMVFKALSHPTLQKKLYKTPEIMYKAASPFFSQTENFPVQLSDGGCIIYII